jgi:hypothetical protein
MQIGEIREAQRRIQFEFTAWPTLCISRLQVSRLWSLPSDVCDIALAHLVDIGFLACADGMFARRTPGRGRFVMRHTEPPQAA